MERKQNLQRNVKYIICWLTGAVLLGILFYFTFPPRRSGKIYEPQIVVFGDSLFGQVRDETAVSRQLSALTGKEIFNGALGGTCLSRINTEGSSTYTKDSLSFVELSRAVALDDFGCQQATVVRENATDYFPEVIDDLEKIDFSKVEILLVQYGVNDYHSGIALENEQDPYDEYTFCGALRSAISFWRKTYPNLRIILLTSTYSWYDYTHLTCEEKDEGGGILEDYVNAQLRVAEELDIEIVDLYHDLYPHESWEDEALYTRDGLHPNDAGRQLLAETIASYLNK